MQDYGAGEFQQGEVWGCRAALMPARKEEAIKEALKPSGMIWQMAEERQRKDGWTNASVCSFRTKNRLMRQYHIWSSHKYRKPAFWFPAVRIKAVQERNCTSHRWRTYAGIYLHPEKSSGHLPSNRQLHHKKYITGSEKCQQIAYYTLFNSVPVIIQDSGEFTSKMMQSCAIPWTVAEKVEGQNLYRV